MMIQVAQTDEVDGGLMHARFSDGFFRVLSTH